MTAKATATLDASVARVASSIASRAMASPAVPTVADSRYRLRDFRGFTVVTPNESELCEAVRIENPDEARIEYIILDGKRIELR